MNYLVAIGLALLSGLFSAPALAGELSDRLCAGFSTDVEIPDDPSAARDAARAELLHAETWYWWARESGNSVEHHCRSRAAYQRAAALLVAGPDADMEQAAKLGQAQVEQRIDNSFDNFRNVFPLAWWLAGSETVLEPQDGPGELPDFLGLAVENAFAQAEPTLTGKTRPVAPAVVRCTGSEEYCEGLRDVLARIADEHERLISIPDDEAGLAMGGLWRSLLAAVPGLPGAIAEPLRVHTGFDRVVVIDAHVVDQVDSPREAFRARVTIDDWDLRYGVSHRLGVGMGVGADAVPTRNFDLLWIALALLAGLAAAPLDRLLGPPSEVPMAHRIGQIAGGLLVGAALGLAAVTLIDPLLPDMEDLALTPDGWIRLPALVWPVAFGGVLLAGPTLLCAFVALGAAPRFSGAVAERLDLGLLIPSTLCGALALGLAQIPVSLGWLGVGTCAALTVPAVVVGVLSGARTERLRGGLDASAGRHVLPVAVGMVGMVAIFPVTLTGLHSGLVLVMGAAIAGLVAGLGRSDAPAEKRDDRRVVHAAQPGSLRRPRYVGEGARALEPVVQLIAGSSVQVISIEAAAGMGKTRMAEQIAEMLGEDWQIGWGEVEDPHLSGGCVQPYAALSGALGSLFEQDQLALDVIYQRQVVAHELAGAAGEVLDFLPGLGLLMGMAGEMDSAELTMERLRRDVIGALRQQLKQGPVAFVLDDLQWIDLSSLSLLDHVLVEIEALPPEERPHPLVVLTCHRPLQGDVADWMKQITSRVAVESVVLEPLTPAGTEGLLKGAGFQALTEDFVEAVRAQVGGVPLHIVMLLQELERSGQIQAESVPGDGEAQLYTAPAGLDADALRKLVPGEISELERQRLARLDDDDLLILQGAAQCGRNFTATDLSTGFSLSRIEVLRRLRDIEVEHDVVLDLDDDDHFRFETEISRSLLLEMSAKRRGSSQREFVKEFHYRVVGDLMARDGGPDWREDADPARIVRHGLNAGHRRLAETARYAARAGAEAARRFAWPESLRFIEVARKHESRLSPEDRARLDLTEARVRRGRGDQGDREIALRRFEGLLDDPHVDAFALARDWFEAGFERKQTADLEALAQSIDKVRAANEGEDPLVDAVADFYQVLTRTWLDGMKPPDDEISGALAAQAAHLRGLADPREKQREMLLAWVLQSQATWTPQGPDYVALCEESLALKEEHGDLAGQALTKGVLANHFLFRPQDPAPARARELLLDDLGILEQMGARGQRSSVLNRLAIADWMAADGDAALRARALEYAQESLREAAHTGRAVDLIFSAFNVLSYGAKSGDAAAADGVGAALVDPPEGWPWADADALWAEVPGWLKGSKARELAGLTEAIAESGAEAGWLEALTGRLG